MAKLNIKKVEWTKEKNGKKCKVTEHVGKHVYRMHYESDPDDSVIDERLKKMKKEKS
ncbi:MAG: hypothetical protein PHX51_07205 [Clostridia bacterium]|nr:hypothetical protein [Clostridia bacterium]